MRKKKDFKKTVGHYFFVINMGYQNKIIISRNTKGEAALAYSNYLKQNKECEWLGQWDGKQFVDTKFNEAA